MAKGTISEPTIEIELTTSQRIAQTQEEIARRKSEADGFEQRAAEIALTDAEQSIALDAKAVATRRYAERLEKNLVTLREQEESERIEHESERIDQAVEVEYHELTQRMEKVRALVLKVGPLLEELREISAGAQFTTDPEAIDPSRFIASWAREGLTTAAGVKVIDEALAWQSQRLRRAALEMKRELMGNRLIGPRSDANPDTLGAVSRLQVRLQRMD